MFMQLVLILDWAAYQSLPKSWNRISRYQNGYKICCIFTKCINHIRIRLSHMNLKYEVLRPQISTINKYHSQ